MDERLKEAFDNLKTLRDEVRLQAHLARAELRDEWEDLEDKWQDVEQKLEQAGDEAREKATEVNVGLKVIVEELSAAYSRIRDRLDGVQQDKD